MRVRTMICTALAVVVLAVAAPAVSRAQTPAPGARVEQQHRRGIRAARSFRAGRAFERRQLVMRRMRMIRRHRARRFVRRHRNRFRGI